MQTTVAGILAVAAAPIEGIRWHASAMSNGAVVYTGIMATTVALSIQIWGQARTSAVRAALIFSLEPVFATIFASLLAGDRVAPNEAGGGILVVVGVAIGQLGPGLLDNLRRQQDRG